MCRRAAEQAVAGDGAPLRYAPRLNRTVGPLNPQQPIQLMLWKFDKPRWRRIVAIVGYSLIGGMMALGADIYRFSFESDSSSADAAIVLGVVVWNGRPSPVFEERINHAVDLYRERKVRFIIFTGGVGINDQLAESVVGSQYALSQGVSAEDMFCETTSQITWENLQGAKAILQQQSLGRVLIVSDPLHMRRALIMARDLGMEARPSPTPTTRYTGFQSQMEFLLREIYFYGLYLIQRPFILFSGAAREMMV